MDYSLKNLREVEDAAAKHGFGASQESRFPRRELGAEATGIAFHVVKPGKRQAFGHRHEQAEEIYVILSGHGRVRLDDEIVDVRPLDAIRVAPHVTRAFEAGQEGLEVLAVGAHHPGDSELDFDFWKD